MRLLFQERGGDMCNQEEAVGAITALSAEFISALVLEETKRRRAKYESYRTRSNGTSELIKARIIEEDQGGKIHGWDKSCLCLCKGNYGFKPKNRDLR